MADNTFNGVVETLIKGMDGFLSAKTVVGDATSIGDTVIVPLVDVSFGVGAGAASGNQKNGGAGAMNGKLSPSAVLVIQNGHTRLVNIKNQDTVTKIIDLVPDVIDRVSDLVKKSDDDIDNNEAREIAFPSEE